jgi:hypothetical protein
VNRNRKRLFMALLILAMVQVGAVLTTTSVFAQTYTQLQILLPGETEAPGTPNGKLGTPQKQTAGVPFAVKVRACDTSWNTVTSVTNIVSITSSDESATLPSATPLVYGEVVLYITLNAAGSFTISAQDETDLTIPEATSAVVTVMAIQGFRFSDIHQKHTYAGVPESYTISAVDPTGEVVTGFTGPVHLRQITSYGEGRILPEEVTLTEGTFSGFLTMYRADESSINRGNVNIFAFLEANPSINGTSDPFIVHPGPFERVQIVVPGQIPAPGNLSGVSGSPATQGSGQNFNVDIYSTDVYWNPVPSSDIVRITSSDPGASTPVSGALTEGFRQFTVSLGTVGTQTFTVTDLTNSSIQGMTSAGIAVIPNAPDHFEIDPIASPIVAGEPVLVTIRATDASGNTIPDYNGNAKLSANTGPGSISPEDIVFSDGVWTGEMVFRGAGGAVALTCADYATPPNIGTSTSFQVLPGAFTGLQVLLPGQIPQGGTTLGFSGTPSDQSAGSSFDITVRAVDCFWNLVPGIDDRIVLSSSDAFADMVPETTLVNGELILPITLFQAGSQTVSISDFDSTGIDPDTSSTVEVLAGPYSRLLILAPGEELAPGSENGRIGAATDQSITFAFTITIYSTDAWWNPVTGVGDLIRITSSDPLAQLPPDTALVNGQIDLSIRLSTGGFQHITVSNLTQPSMPPSTTEVRAISSGLHLEAEVNPTTVQAGEPFTLTVKVTNDAGSIIQEINSFVDVEVQNASTQQPGMGTLLTTRFQLLQGQRSIQETYTFAESIVLIVRDEGGSAPAVTDVILIEPGPPEIIELACNPSWVRGNKHAVVSAVVTDIYDNGVPAQPVKFQVMSGTGTLTPIDSITDSDGIARADFLSPRIPEISRIRAISNTLLAELDIETALVNPNLPAGTITNYPNPFHPGEAPTTIAYKLSDDADVTLHLYTLSGGLVLRQEFSSGGPGGLEGLNEYKWNGRNGSGDYVSSGGYILVIEAKGDGETLHVMRRKIAVVR